MRNNANERFGARRIGGEPARHMNFQYKAWEAGLQLPVGRHLGGYFADFFRPSS